MQHLWDVVGYVYCADTYCGACVVERVAQHSECDEPMLHSYEADLTRLAEYVGIERMDESSFDSDHFPKVIFRDQVEDDLCAGCGDPLDD